MATKLQQPADHGALPAEGYIRLPQILAVIPISKSSWWAGVRSGRYPPPVKLGPRTTAWAVDGIRKLLQNTEEVCK